MAQVLRMETEKKQLTLGEIKKFVSTAEQYGILMSDVVDVSSSRASGQVVFRKSLPERTHNKVVKSKSKPSKKETPEPKSRKVSVPKNLKCPVCNVRKPIVKVAGVTALKPHQSHGEPCSGSGAQVVGSKVKVS